MSHGASAALPGLPGRGAPGGSRARSVVGSLEASLGGLALEPALGLDELGAAIGGGRRLLGRAGDCALWRRHGRRSSRSLIGIDRAQAEGAVCPRAAVSNSAARRTLLQVACGRACAGRSPRALTVRERDALRGEAGRRGHGRAARRPVALTRWLGCVGLAHGPSSVQVVVGAGWSGVACVAVGALGALLRDVRDARAVARLPRSTATKPKPVPLLNHFCGTGRHCRSSIETCAVRSRRSC